MFDQGRLEGSGPGGGRTPGQLLADRIAARDRRIRAEEVGTVLDLKEWLDLHSVDEANPFATGPAGGAGKRSGSAGTPWVDEFAVAEYAPLRHWPDPTARAFLIDVADLEHRFPSLWTACTVDQSVPVWQARQIVKACRDLSQAAAAKVDAEIAAKLPRLSWGRALSVLAAAIMTADPVLAETKRREAKQARFVQLCRSEGGIRTMIVRAEDGDLIMVYALVDRLADILRLDGSAETADQRRATAFGLLAQPAMVLQMLIRHAADGPAATGPGGTGIGSADPATAHRDRPDAEQPARPGDDPDPEADPASADDHEAEAAKPHPTGQPDTDQPDADQPDTDRPDTDQPDTDQSGSARRWPSEPGDDPDTGTSRGGDPDAEDTTPPSTGHAPHDPGPAPDDEPPPANPPPEPPERRSWVDDNCTEPPPWTADDWDEPPDPAPVDHIRIPDRWDQHLRPRPGPEPPAPPREPDDPDPPDPDAPDTSGLRLNLPGLAGLLTDHGLRAARPRVVLHVHLTDATLRTGTGVVRTDGCAPMLATQLREFLGRHSCQISVRPVLDLGRIPAVDAYEIPASIREAVRTRQVASVFPYSSGRGASMDLDHTDPYRRDGTPGQTGPANLAPLTRGEHRAKTHGLWTVTTPHPGVYLWRAPHGHYFLCTNQGTQHLGPLSNEGCPIQTTAGLPAVELIHTGQAPAPP